MLLRSERLASLPVLSESSDEIDRYIFHGMNDTPPSFCLGHGIATELLPWQAV